MGQATFTLSALIVNIKGDRTLELIGKNSIKPESLREYFRVDTKVKITAEFEPLSPDSRTPPWTLEGTTLDLSGSGVLAIFQEKPLSKHHISIRIDLHNNQEPLECLGHIIKTKRLPKKRYQVSFHFDSMLQKAKDAIISFCLKEQRNRLRDKIQTID